MTTTYSPALRVALQGTGDNSGTWGLVANNNVFLMLEQAIAGVATIDISGTGSYVLSTNNGTTDEARNYALVLSGTLTGDRNVIVPTINKIYVVNNITSGAFTLTIKTALGTGVTIPSGGKRIVYCDGTNVVDGSPTQSKPGYGTASAPSYSFYSDHTSGYNATEAGILTMSVSGTEMMRINSTGVGIGTSPATSRLCINGRAEQSVVALTPSATIAWDLSAGNMYTLALNRSSTILNPTNMIAGTVYTLVVTQDSVGTRSLVYDSAYSWGDNGAPILSDSAGATDILVFYCDGSRMLGIYNLGY